MSNWGTRETTAHGPPGGGRERASARYYKHCPPDPDGGRSLTSMGVGVAKSLIHSTSSR